MIVVDTSAVLDVLAKWPADPSLTERLAGEDLHAPHVIDLEILHALRRLVTVGALSAARAADVRSDYHRLAILRYPHQPLADRIWDLRDNLSAYDGAFVALAEVLGVVLVTTDGRLARAPGHGAVVELYS